MSLVMEVTLLVMASFSPATKNHLRGSGSHNIMQV